MSAQFAQPALLAAGALTAVGVGAAALRLCSLSRGPERRNWNGSVFGHRGCRFVKGIVENTLPAYEYALAKGADGIEIDVRMCATGELVVFHDDTTTPMCHGPRRRIADMSLAEVQALRFVDDPTGTVRPPLVEEVLDLCVARGCKLLFELKHYSWSDGLPAAVAAVVALAEKYPVLFDRKVIVISFNPVALYLIRKARPSTAVGPLYDDHTISNMAKGDSDAGRVWWLSLLFPRVLDRVFASSVDTWASSVMGASLTCTRVDLCDAATARRHTEEGRLVYLYGLGSQLPESLRGCKATVACDDDHDQLVASVK